MHEDQLREEEDRAKRKLELEEAQKREREAREAAVREKAEADEARLRSLQVRPKEKLGSVSRISQLALNVSDTPKPKDAGFDLNKYKNELLDVVDERELEKRYPGKYKPPKRWFEECI